MSQKDREYYAYNAERMRERSRLWRLANPERMHQYNLRHIKFRSKSVFLDENPQKGVCSKCGKQGRTNMHHDVYDERDPLAHTRELCQLCHHREHRGLPMSAEERKIMKREWIQNWRNNNREESRRKDREYYHRNRLRILAKKKEKRG